MVVAGQASRLASLLHLSRSTTTSTGVEMQGQQEQHDALPELKSRSRRVLLAEGDAALRRLLARMLRRSGFDVIESSSGYETLEWLGRSLIDEPPIDLVISDVR